MKEIDFTKLIIDKLFNGDIAGPFEYNDVRELANELKGLLLERDAKIQELEYAIILRETEAEVAQQLYQDSKGRIKELEKENEGLRAKIKEAEEIGGYRF